MKTLIAGVNRFMREEEGVTAIEYALIAALIAVVIIVGARAVGLNINNLFQAVATLLNGAVTNANVS